MLFLPFWGAKRLFGCRIRIAGVAEFQIGITIVFQYKVALVFDGVCWGAIEILFEETREVAGRVESAAEHEVLDGDGGVVESFNDEILLLLGEPDFHVATKFILKSFDECTFGHAQEFCKLLHGMNAGIVLQYFASEIQTLANDLVENVQELVVVIQFAQHDEQNTFTVEMKLKAFHTCVQTIHNEVDEFRQAHADGKRGEDVGRRPLMDGELLKVIDIAFFYDGGKLQDENMRCVHDDDFAFLIAGKDIEIAFLNPV